MTVYKESVLFVGGDSVGKTSLLLEIAEFHPDASVIVIDFENKVAKIKDSLYYDLENIDVRTVKNWGDVIKAFEDAKKKLGVGDWLMIDGLDKAWDMLQAEYDSSKHGPDMWKWVKEMHNKDFMDKATGLAPFHCAATAWAAPNVDFNIDREIDAAIRDSLQMWQQFGFRPGGEKRNTSRFDTIFALKTQLNPVKRYVATYKDKGSRPYIDGGDRSLWREFDFPFWPLYVEECQKEQERIDAAPDTGRRKPRVIPPQ